jgi:hypothetical protein
MLGGRRLHLQRATRTARVETGAPPYRYLHSTHSIGSASTTRVASRDLGHDLGGTIWSETSLGRDGGINNSPSQYKAIVGVKDEGLPGRHGSLCHIEFSEDAARATHVSQIV